MRWLGCKNLFIYKQINFFIKITLKHMTAFSPIFKLACSVPAPRIENTHCQIVVRRDFGRDWPREKRSSNSLSKVSSGDSVESLPEQDIAIILEESWEFSHMCNVHTGMQETQHDDLGVIVQENRGPDGPRQVLKVFTTMSQERVCAQSVKVLHARAAGRRGLKYLMTP